MIRKFNLLKSLLLALLWLTASLPTTAAADGMKFHELDEDQASRFFRLAMKGDQDQIFASGEIELNTAQQLRNYVVTRNISWAKVTFDSPGGSLIGGLLLGEAIRDLGFDTEVASGEPNDPAVCASACAYAFAGGVNRFYAGSARLGLHQFYGPDDNLANAGDTQEISAAIIAYLGRMGVESSAFVRASGARSNQMVWLEPIDAVELGLANNGTMPTTAEIRLAGMLPYLRLNQIQSDVTTRVLLSCYAGGVRGMFGIVTDPSITNARFDSATKSYVSLDGTDRMVLLGTDGLKAEDSALWLTRQITSQDLALLESTRQLDVWTENGSDFRWGGGIDLTEIHEDLISFVTNCTGSQ